MRKVCFTARSNYVTIKSNNNDYFCSTLRFILAIRESVIYACVIKSKNLTFK